MGGRGGGGGPQAESDTESGVGGTGTSTGSGGGSGEATAESDVAAKKKAWETAEQTAAAALVAGAKAYVIQALRNDAKQARLEFIAAQGASTQATTDATTDGILVSGAGASGLFRLDMGGFSGVTTTPTGIDALKEAAKDTEAARVEGLNNGGGESAAQLVLNKAALDADARLREALGENGKGKNGSNSPGPINVGGAPGATSAPFDPGTTAEQIAEAEHDLAVAKAEKAAIVKAASGVGGDPLGIERDNDRTIARIEERLHVLRAQQAAAEAEARAAQSLSGAAKNVGGLGGGGAGLTVKPGSGLGDPSRVVVAGSPEDTRTEVQIAREANDAARQSASLPGSQTGVNENDPNVKATEKALKAALLREKSKKKPAISSQIFSFSARSQELDQDIASLADSSNLAPVNVRNGYGGFSVATSVSDKEVALVSARAEKENVTKILIGLERDKRVSLASAAVHSFAINASVSAKNKVVLSPANQSVSNSFSGYIPALRALVREGVINSSQVDTAKVALGEHNKYAQLVAMQQKNNEDSAEIDKVETEIDSIQAQRIIDSCDAIGGWGCTTTLTLITTAEAVDGVAAFRGITA